MERKEIFGWLTSHGNRDVYMRRERRDVRRENQKAKRVSRSSESRNSKLPRVLNFWES